MYQNGTLVRCTAIFTDFAGTAADPTVVVFKVRGPSGIVTSSTPTKDSVGHYHTDISTPNPGKYYYRFEGSGAAEVASEGLFSVSSSALV